MNTYYLTIKFENTTFCKKINVQANCQSDAITAVLNKLSKRDFDNVERIEVIADRGNIELLYAVN